MASRGAYVSGTDGSDFKNREVVVDHYKVSAENKPRLRFAIVMHWMLAALMIVRLIPGLILATGSSRVPHFIKHLNLPQVHLWELVWLLSSVASVFGYLSLNKNNGQLLSYFMTGLF